MPGTLLVEPLLPLGSDFWKPLVDRLIDDEFVDDDAVPRRRFVQNTGPIVVVLFGGFGLLIDSHRGDEFLSLAVPPLDHRRLQGEVGPNDQRRHVGQNVFLEKLNVIFAVGLDGRVEAEPAVHQLGDRPDDQFLNLDIPRTFHRDRVLSRRDVPHRFGAMDCLDIALDHRQRRCHVVKLQRDGPLAAAVRDHKQEARAGASERIRTIRL